jgi:hypothetical protein
VVAVVEAAAEVAEAAAAAEEVRHLLVANLNNQLLT